MSQTKQPTNTAVITCITIIKNTLSTGFPVKRIFYPTQQSRIIFRSLPRSTMGILGSAIFLQAHSMVHRLLRFLCRFRWQSAHLPGRSHGVPAEKHDTPLECLFIECLNKEKCIIQQHRLILKGMPDKGSGCIFRNLKFQRHPIFSSS